MKVTLQDLEIYLQFKPKDDLFFESEFLDQYPDAVRKMWWFFNGRIDRIVENPELHELYENLYEYVKDSGAQ